MEYIAGAGCVDKRGRKSENQMRSKRDRAGNFLREREGKASTRTEKEGAPWCGLKKKKIDFFKNVEERIFQGKRAKDLDERKIIRSTSFKIIRHAVCLNLIEPELNKKI